MQLSEAPWTCSTNVMGGVVRNAQSQPYFRPTYQNLHSNRCLGGVKAHSSSRALHLNIFTGRPAKQLWEDETEGNVSSSCSLWTKPRELFTRTWIKSIQNYKTHFKIHRLEMGSECSQAQGSFLR